MRASEFVALVGRMRKHQDEYFKTRSPAALRAAKECERKVDAIVAANQDSKQGRLFPESGT